MERKTANKYKSSKSILKYPILISQNKKKIPFECFQSYETLKFVILNYLVLHKQIVFCFFKSNKVLMIHYIG